MFEFSRAELIMLAAPTALFILVLELVRSRRLREDYSLLWLGTFGILIVLAIFSDSLLEFIARMMGIFYPPAALFVIGFLLTLAILLQYSLVITRLARENKQAAQHVALLAARVHDLEQRLKGPAEGAHLG